MPSKAEARSQDVWIKRIFFAKPWRKRRRCRGTHMVTLRYAARNTSLVLVHREMSSRENERALILVEEEPEKS